MCKEGGRQRQEDRVLASQFGAKAVEVLKDGRGGVCIGLDNEKFVEREIIDTLDNLEHKPNLDFTN